MKTKSELFNKRGNAAGFTAEGRAVCGCYRARSKAWEVWTEAAEAAKDARKFETPEEADAYARSLMDVVKTEELKWW